MWLKEMREEAQNAARASGRRKAKAKARTAMYTLDQGLLAERDGNTPRSGCRREDQRRYYTSVCASRGKKLKLVASEVGIGILFCTKIR